MPPDFTLKEGQIKLKVSRGNEVINSRLESNEIENVKTVEKNAKIES